jgi:hypothetical protein
MPKYYETNGIINGHFGKHDNRQNYEQVTLLLKSICDMAAKIYIIK